ncbi:hypothetical protein CR513_59347, partial [Mucuna pruriens]
MLNGTNFKVWKEVVQIIFDCMDLDLTAMLNAFGAISFTISYQDPFFEMGNARFLEEVEFEKEDNTRNVVFEEESINNIGQVLIPITVQETTQVIEDNVRTIVPDIVPEQDYDEINLNNLKKCQDETCNSLNSKKWIDAMKDEMNSMQDNGVWDLVELLEGVKPISCKWIFKTKKDSKGNIEIYMACLVGKGFTHKEDIDYKEAFSPILRDRSQGILRLSKDNYINKVLDRFDMKDIKQGDTLIAKGDKFNIK